MPKETANWQLLPPTMSLKVFLNGHAHPYRLTPPEINKALGRGVAVEIIPQGMVVPKQI